MTTCITLLCPVYRTHSNGVCSLSVAVLVLASMGYWYISTSLLQDGIIVAHSRKIVQVNSTKYDYF